MTSEQATCAAISGFTAVIAGALAAAAWRRRDPPGNRLLSWLMTAVSWWAATAAAAGTSATAGAQVTWSALSYLGVVCVAPCWFLYAHAYAGQPPPQRGRKIALWALPVAVVLLLPFNGHHHLIWTSIRQIGPAPDALVVFKHGAAVWALTLYSYALVMYGSVLLLRTAWRSAELYRWQVVCLVVGCLAPLLTSVAYMAGGNPLNGYDPSPLGFSVSGIALAVAACRFGILDLVPVACHEVIAQMRDAVLVTAPSGRLVAANPAAAELLQVDASAIGRPLAEVLSERPQLSQAVTAKAPSVEVSEADRVLDVGSGELVCDRGLPLGRWFVLRDVTARAQAEAERLRLLHQLQDARRLEALGMLSAGLAHEYNNILTAIMGNADLAYSLLDDHSECHLLLGEVLNGTRRAARLTSQMLACGGQGRNTVALVDLAVLAAEAVEELNPDDVPPCVELDVSAGRRHAAGDPAQLRFLIRALLANSIEALPRVGGMVHLTLNTVSLSEPLDSAHPAMAPLAPGEYMELTVSDNGSGMDADTRSHVGEPFFTTKFLGRGLGLPAVFGIVRSHEGSVAIESEPGQGTTVRVWLPVAQSDQLTPGRAA